MQSLEDKAEGKQSKSPVLCSPGAFVVEEENQEEFLAGFFLSLAHQGAARQRRHREGDSIMQKTLLRHVWIYDLQNKSNSTVHLTFGMSLVCFKHCSQTQKTGYLVIKKKKKKKN